MHSNLNMEVNLNESLIYTLPVELVENIFGAILFLKALGGVIFIYLVFSIINVVINRKRHYEVKKINKNLEDIKKILKKK